MSHGRRVSVDPAPGEPHRRWDAVDPELGRGDAILLLMGSDSKVAVRKLIAGTEDLTKDEIISLGRLNYHCFLKGYEPMVGLFRSPKIIPAIPDLIGDQLTE